MCIGQVSAAMGTRLVEDSLSHARLVDMCAFSHKYPNSVVKRIVLSAPCRPLFQLARCRNWMFSVSASSSEINQLGRTSLGMQVQAAARFPAKTTLIVFR